MKLLTLKKILNDRESTEKKWPTKTELNSVFPATDAITFDVSGNSVCVSLSKIWPVDYLLVYYGTKNESA